MANEHVVDLTSILTPTLFYNALKLRLPWSRQEEIDPTTVTKCWFRGGSNYKGFADACYPALKAMSTLGLENIPDLMQFLPPPENKDFPEQALGLLILLDQGPRLFEGVDTRYCNAYFDVIALRFSKVLLALPAHLRPDAKSRWIDEMGYSFEHWILARFWFIAPLAHSENIENQRVQSAMVEEGRKEVERHTGKKDPYRDTLQTDMNDPTAFSRNAMGAPKGDIVTIDELVFWFLMIFDLHLPIIATFGRFPYRNGAMGRESTDDEKNYLAKTNNWGSVDESAAKQIRQDMLAGRWSPLGIS